jgi:hypothetical protein
MERRQFVKNSMATLGSLASSLGAEHSSAQEPGPARAEESDKKIGRPVRAVSIGFHPGMPLERIAE